MAEDEDIHCEKIFESSKIRSSSERSLNKRNKPSTVDGIPEIAADQKNDIEQVKNSVERGKRFVLLVNCSSLMAHLIFQIFQ